MKGLGRKTRYSVEGKAKSKAKKYRAGRKTEVGKEAKVQSYKEYVKGMYGGGLAKHGYDTANVTGKGGLIDFMERGPANRISSRGPYAAGRPYKVGGCGVMNPDEPMGVGPGGMKKGGRTKKKS